MVDQIAPDLERFAVRPGPGVAALSAVLEDPANSLLGLDFDGTLSPIIDRPENAVIHPEGARALDRLSRRLGTVAIITGRPARAAVELGGLAQLAGAERMVVLGQYGAERWDGASGEFTIPPPPEGIAQVREAVTALVDEVGIPGVTIENKFRAIGIHWRTAADPQRATAALIERARAIAAEHDFGVEPGRSVLEIRPPGKDKGMALAELIAERGVRAQIFGGDDLGDLPAYDEVVRQRALGIPGLLIASASPEQNALLERADVVCHGPAEVATWLHLLADELDRRVA